MKWTSIVGQCCIAAAGFTGAATAAPASANAAWSAVADVGAPAPPARAQAPVPTPVQARASAQAPASAQDWSQQRVPAARLADARGGDDTSNVDNTAHVHGAVGSNTANNVATGMNSISGGAFANAVGLPVVIQNSGANVLIQNSTIINLQLR